MNISIVTPVFNDWESLRLLLIKLKSTNCDDFSIEKVLVINDGSQQTCPEDILNDSFVDILNLSTNVGHQRAIALGLCYFNEHNENSEYVVVMDSDGEDKPSDIPFLVKSALNNPSKIIFAKRNKRSEGLLFIIHYNLYKIFFRLLTGDKISFGNFSCVPQEKVFQIISNPNSWNHYSGSILKSKLPFVEISSDRGVRYAGKSKMNFSNLISHGLSSIALYIDIIGVRLLIMNIFLVALSFLSLTILFSIKFFSDYHIPGWTPIYTLGIFNVLLLSSIFILMLVLVQLGNRNNVNLPPNNFFKNFIVN